MPNGYSVMKSIHHALDALEIYIWILIGI